MCYPCTMCNGCGKLNPGSPLFVPKVVVKCLDCGGDVDEMSGKCLGCGKQVMIPLVDETADGSTVETADEPVAETAGESVAESVEEICVDAVGETGEVDSALDSVA
ncbi:MAG: hypothetical protein IJF97_03550 [Eggerthellaceae bacterium]|nr:hypothetical protein [Eggerthellaceae bacterium]MBQ6390636.1 hypothetical protein [Eggerthellaceae bacterium]